MCPSQNLLGFIRKQTATATLVVILICLLDLNVLCQRNRRNRIVYSEGLDG